MSMKPNGSMEFSTPLIRNFSINAVVQGDTQNSEASKRQASLPDMGDTDGPIDEPYFPPEKPVDPTPPKDPDSDPDKDTDGDGIPDKVDPDPTDPTKPHDPNKDTDGDGIPDDKDDDDDNDGIPDDTDSDPKDPTNPSKPDPNQPDPNEPDPNQPVLKVIIDNKQTEICKDAGFTVEGTVEGPNPISSIALLINGTKIDQVNFDANGSPSHENEPPAEPEEPQQPEPPQPSGSDVKYFCDSSIPVSSINTSYWTGNKAFDDNVGLPGGKQLYLKVDAPFFEGRNDWLNFMEEVRKNLSPTNPIRYNKSVVQLGDFHTFLWKLVQDAKAGTVTLPEPWSQFKTWAKTNLSCMTELQLGMIYASYKIKVPCLMFSSAANYLQGDIIDKVAELVAKTHTFTYHWIDFNDLKTDPNVAAWAKDGELEQFYSYINFEPDALNADPINLMAHRPTDYTASSVTNKSEILEPIDKYSGYWLSVGSLGKGGFPVLYANKEVCKPFVAAEIAIHEIGHAVGFYGADFYKTAAGHKYSADIGLALHDYKEWHEISGWDKINFESMSQDYKLKKTKPGAKLDNGLEAPVTAYGCSHPAEDFAEAYRLYVLNPTFLKTYFPKKYTFMEKFVKNMSSIDMSVSGLATRKDKTITLIERFKEERNVIRMLATGTNEVPYKFDVPSSVTSKYNVGDSFLVEVKGTDNAGNTATDRYVVTVKDCSIDPNKPPEVNTCLMADSLHVEYFNETMNKMIAFDVPFDWLPHEVDNGNGAKANFAFDSAKNGVVVQITDGASLTDKNFQLYALGINYIDKFNNEQITWSTKVIEKTAGVKNENLMIGNPASKDPSIWVNAIKNNGDYSSAPAIGKLNDYAIFQFDDVFQAEHCPINQNYKPEDHQKPPADEDIPDPNGPNQVRNCLKVEKVHFQYYSDIDFQLHEVTMPFSTLDKTPYKLATKRGTATLQIGWSDQFKGMAFKISDLTAQASAATFKMMASNKVLLIGGSSLQEPTVSILRQYIQGKGFTVDMDLGTDAMVANYSSYKCIIVYWLNEGFSQKVIDGLKVYMSGPGSMLVCAEHGGMPSWNATFDKIMEGTGVSVVGACLVTSGSSQATVSTTHPIAKSVSTFTMNCASSFNLPSGFESIAMIGGLPVIAARQTSNSRLVIQTDYNFLDNNGFNDAGNRQLVENILNWTVVEPPTPPEPPAPVADAVVHLTSVGVSYKDYYDAMRTIYSDHVSYTTSNAGNADKMVGKPKTLTECEPWATEVKNDNIANAPVIGIKDDFVVIGFPAEFESNSCPIDSHVDDEIGNDPQYPYIELDVIDEHCKNNKIIVKGTVSHEKGITEIFISFNNGEKSKTFPVSGTEVTFEEEFATGAFPVGSMISIYVKASNQLGNMVEDEEQFEVPACSPPVINLDPISEACHNFDLPLTGSIDSESGLAQVTYEIDGQIVSQESFTEADGYPKQWDIEALLDKSKFPPLKLAPNNQPGAPESIMVEVDKLTMFAWDDGAEDGDIVNIYLTNKNQGKTLIKSNWSLKNDSNSTNIDFLDILLAEGDNIIIFEGISPGSSGDLTASIKLLNHGSRDSMAAYPRLQVQDPSTGQFTDRTSNEFEAGIPRGSVSASPYTFSDPKPYREWHIYRKPQSSGTPSDTTMTVKVIAIDKDGKKSEKTITISLHACDVDGNPTAPPKEGEYPPPEQTIYGDVTIRSIEIPSCVDRGRMIIKGKVTGNAQSIKVTLVDSTGKMIGFSTNLTLSSNYKGVTKVADGYEFVIEKITESILTYTRLRAYDTIEVRLNRGQQSVVKLHLPASQFNFDSSKCLILPQATVSSTATKKARGAWTNEPNHVLLLSKYTHSKYNQSINIYLNGQLQKTVTVPYSSSAPHYSKNAIWTEVPITLQKGLNTIEFEYNDSDQPVAGAVTRNITTRVSIMPASIPRVAPIRILDYLAYYTVSTRDKEGPADNPDKFRKKVWTVGLE